MELSKFHIEKKDDLCQRLEITPVNKWLNPLSQELLYRHRVY